jgi:hypothetical protein
MSLANIKADPSDTRHKSSDEKATLSEEACGEKRYCYGLAGTNLAGNSVVWNGLAVRRTRARPRGMAGNAHNH